MQKLDKDSAPLREGTVDLETGVIANTMGPELRTQALFRDRFIGVVRMGHSLSDGELSPTRYATGRHIGISRQGLEMGPIDEAMSALGSVWKERLLPPSVDFRLRWRWPVRQI